MSDKIRVVVWNEFRHEREDEKVKAIYPDGMHSVLAGYLKKQDGLDVSVATLDEPEHGLTDEVLENTDVMLWWGHKAHGEVQDEIAAKVQQRVLAGMGLIVLHAGHNSKVFKRLMGTNCSLKWRVADEKERLWNIAPGHPITKGIGEYITLEKEEMYGEMFDVPEPDKLIFVSWFEGGEVFRSGCCWNRGLGRVFYFRPGHETYPSFYNEDVLKVIGNAVYWAKPQKFQPTHLCTGVKEPLEKISPK